MIRILNIIFITGVIACLASPSFAEQPDMQAQIRALEKQVAELQKSIQALKTESAASKAEVQSLKTKTASHNAPGLINLGGNAADDVTITMAPTPKISSGDGEYIFQPFGRIHLDTAFFNDDKTDHPDGSTFRSARLGFKGNVAKDLRYKFELDFGNKNATDSTSFRDVYLEYTGLKSANIMVGNFKPAFGLEELMSGNYTTFIERSLPTTTFGTGEIIGAQAYHGSKHYSWAVGVHNDLSTTKSSDDEAKSVVGRLTLAPINEPGKLLHIGVSTAYRVPDSASDSVTFGTNAENALQTRRSAYTGTISDTKSVTLAGLEAAGVYGPVSLQGEYFYTDVARQGVANSTLNGWYTQASWFITGESRPYDSNTGIFTRVKPTHSFDLDSKQWGAWELATRYSTLDLNDGGIQGGKIRDITLGLNWHLNPYTRLMANYILVNTDQVTPSGANAAANDDPTLLLLRAQVDF